MWLCLANPRQSSGGGDRGNAHAGLPGIGRLAERRVVVRRLHRLSAAGVVVVVVMVVMRVVMVVGRGLQVEPQAVVALAAVAVEEQLIQCRHLVIVEQVPTAARPQPRQVIVAAAQLPHVTRLRQPAGLRRSHALAAVARVGPPAGRIDAAALALAAAAHRVVVMVVGLMLLLLRRLLLLLWLL